MNFDLMLASRGPEDLEQLRYPVLASAKLDGLRVVMWDGVLWSRNRKPVRNRHVQEQCAKHVPQGVDGELMLEDMTLLLRHVQSAMSSADGRPLFCIAAFDLVRENALVPYGRRLGTLKALPPSPYHRVLAQTLCLTADDLRGQMAIHAEAGYEGTMVRCPVGRYKYGRSTQREQLLLKYKAFDDEEAVVTGVEEEMENLNLEGESSKEMRRPKGRLGKVRCRFLSDDTEFRCGSGFDAAERELYWSDPSLIVGKIITVKHQPPPGGRPAGEKPRFPVFKCVREP